MLWLFLPSISLPCRVCDRGRADWCICAFVVCRQNRPYARSACTLRGHEKRRTVFCLHRSQCNRCCSQGLEFVLEGTYAYPQDYPSLGTEITVTGEFRTYEESGNLYSHLTDAKRRLNKSRYAYIQELSFITTATRLFAVGWLLL